MSIPGAEASAGSGLALALGAEASAEAGKAVALAAGLLLALAPGLAPLLLVSRLRRSTLMSRVVLAVPLASLSLPLPPLPFPLPPPVESLASPTQAHVLPPRQRRHRIQSSGASSRGDGAR